LDEFFKNKNIKRKKEIINLTDKDAQIEFLINEVGLHNPENPGKKITRIEALLKRLLRELETKRLEIKSFWPER